MVFFTAVFFFRCKAVIFPAFGGNELAQIKGAYVGNALCPASCSLVSLCLLKNPYILNDFPKNLKSFSRTEQKH